MKKQAFKILAMAAMLAVPAVQPSVAKEPAKATVAEGVSTKQSLKKYYVTSNVLNIRSGPGTDYSILGTLTKGMEVKVVSIKVEKGNRWAKIRFEGITAYAFAKHLAKTGKNTSSDAMGNTSTKQSAGNYYVTSDALNVRSGPGTDYSLLGTLTRGMHVKVISIEGEKENRWAKIKFEGLTAYVYAKHLAKE